MDRGDAVDISWNDDEGSSFDPLDLDDIGGGEPPVPPEEPPGRGPGGPERRPPRPDDVVFHPVWTAGALGLISLFGALNVVALQVGARGGVTAVALIVGIFGLLFFVPFVAGAWWFGRMQDRDR